MVAGALAVVTPFDHGFVASLKAAVPTSDRKWDAAQRAWMVEPAHGATVQTLIARHYGQNVDLPAMAHSKPRTEMRLLDVRYIGAAKAREDGSETASGWSEGGWTVIFPKSVLMDYFGQTTRPGESGTLYGVLGVSQSVDADALKKSWRRLVMQWHPDRAKEPGAREQFEAIQVAYDTLSVPKTRARYDAGLALQAMYQQSESTQVQPHYEWRCPVRCGLILANGQERLGRFLVSDILQWGDIIDKANRTLVTTWAIGDDHFSETWVEQ